MNAFRIMQDMGNKLDGDLLNAFRPVVEDAVRCVSAELSSKNIFSERT
jgi:hypothetical protein